MTKHKTSERTQVTLILFSRNHHDFLRSEVNTDKEFTHYIRPRPAVVVVSIHGPLYLYSLLFFFRGNAELFIRQDVLNIIPPLYSLNM